MTKITIGFENVEVVELTADENTFVQMRNAKLNSMQVINGDQGLLQFNEVESVYMYLPKAVIDNATMPAHWDEDQTIAERLQEPDITNIQIDDGPDYNVVDGHIDGLPDEMTNSEEVIVHDNGDIEIHISPEILHKHEEEQRAIERQYGIENDAHFAKNVEAIESPDLQDIFRQIEENEGTIADINKNLDHLDELMAETDRLLGRK